MKAARLKGKTIAKVHQVRHGYGEGCRTGSYVIDAIEFTDGSVLRFVVAEGESEYGVEGVYPGKAIAHV